MRAFIIDDDPIMTDCLGYAVQSAARPSLSSSEKNSQPDLQIFKFTNVIDAMTALNESLPDLILLDVLLSGPDGFSLLNELMTYSDTATIPVILITSLTLPEDDLSHYGVRAILCKETMTPKQLEHTIQEVLSHA